MATIRGSGQPQRQADEKEWSGSNGWQTVEVYEGTKDAILGLAQSLTASSGYTRIRVYSTDNVAYRLNATIGGFDGPETETPTNSWEVHGMGIQEDIFNHPKSRALGEAQLGSIQDYLANPSKRQNSSPALTTPDGHTLWNMVKNGQTSYQRSYFILRNTQTASSYAALTYSLAGIEQVWTTAQLPLAEMPPEVSAFVRAIPAETPATGFTFGWLKQSPQLTKTFGSRGQLTTEWWLYSWSNYVYTNYTP